MNLVEKLIAAVRAKKRRILVIGDGMTDVYVHGHLHGTCQDGCPKFVEEYRVAVPGGAENAARTLACWQPLGIEIAYKGIPEGYGPKKTRYMVDSRCVFRHDDDRIRCDLELIRLNAERAIKAAYDAILLSDYDKGLLTSQLIRMAADECKRRGLPCVADCKRPPLTYTGCILKGNSDYISRYGFSANVSTFGSAPPMVGDAGLNINAKKVKCVNHIGAGDCFASHLTLALAYGFSLKESAAIAHAAGRVYVQQPHNTPPALEAMVKDMSSWAE